MVQDFTPGILADEASEMGMLAQGSVTASVLLIFKKAVVHMVPWFIVAVFVILLDLAYGIKAARKRGEPIRISRAIRRTIGKTFEYICWVIIASTISAATGFDIIEVVILLVVIGIEIISVVQNAYFAKYGKKVDVDVIKAGVAVLEGKTGVDLGDAVHVEERKEEKK